MKNQYVVGSSSAIGSSQPTLTAQEAPRSTPRPAVALVPGSGPHLSDEIHCMLRRRLRIANLVGLTGSTLFLLKSIYYPSALPGPSSTGIALHSSVIAVWALAGALLWTKWCFSARVLRALELAMFSSLGLFFCYLQFRSFDQGHCFDMIQISDRAAVSAMQDDLLAFINATNSMRWFMLIVLYGTFIPNTWKRAAIVIGVMACTPLLLNLAICLPCSFMGKFTWPIFWDSTLIVGMGSAIALFGSFKISSLQTEAYRARKLGQYQLVRKLGAGGMGEVYLGEHRLLRRTCAIKLIRPDQAGDPTNLSRFEREVQAMATLTHWNSVEVYDYGRAEDGTFYYVMEYLPGLSLQELVDQHGTLSPARAIHFLRQLCEALREAHSIGLIHRDIKPSNVIVCQRGQVYDVAKLLDFGLVHDLGVNKRDQQITMQGTILGSPPFISPEQARGASTVDRRSDIYSLGGLAYFLVTGQAPFVRATVLELLAAHLHETPVSPREVNPDVGADFEEVILTCLQKDPAKRFHDIDSLEAALASCDAADQWTQAQAQQWWVHRPAFGSYRLAADNAEATALHHPAVVS